MTYRYTALAKPSKLDEFDSYMSIAIKAFSDATYTSRRNMASATGYILSLSQEPKKVAKPSGKSAAADNTNAADQQSM
jgi:hypothetical protein